MKLSELKNQFPAAPEYLTQIYLIQRDHGIVPNARLADRLGVSRPAVSQAVGRLRKLNLVEQDRYGAINLSDSGRVLAENVVKRHFLLEHLLVKILKFPWDLSDEEAESLQASLSDRLTDHLDEFLGHPQTCPHGNPMPHSSLEKSLLEAPKLTEAEDGTMVKVIRVTEEGELTPGMLGRCQELTIGPGTLVTVLSRDDQDMRLKTEDGKTYSLEMSFAQHIRWDKA